MNRLEEEGVFGGMAGQKNGCRKKRNARSTWASGAAGTILPPGLAIPCWVAPLQSPTPFRQAKDSIPHIAALDAALLPAALIENRHKRLSAPREQNRHKRLSARWQDFRKIPAWKTGTVGIIVTDTHPQSTHCRF